MNKHTNFIIRLVTLCILPMTLATSCSIDDKYDLSKDVDMTVGVAKGLSLPIGSTEKIMLTELIDTAETDIVKIDNMGYYSVYKNGTFDAESFSVSNLDVVIDPITDPEVYDFELINLSNLEDLPQWIKDKMAENLYPHIIKEDIDNTVDFKISQDVPEEIKKIRSATFRQPAKMVLELEIYSDTHESDDILEITDKLYVSSKEAKGFVIEVPEYLIFAPESNITNSKLVIDGYLKYNAATQKMTLKKEFTIIGLDFSKLPEGYITVSEDNCIELDDNLNARGIVESDTVFFGFNNITHAQHIDVEPKLTIDKIVIDKIEGIFDPVIEPINEVVDLELGDDLDFLKEAYLDFSDPRIYVTFTNPIDARIFADAEFVGYDKDGLAVEGSQVATNLTFAGAVTNKFCINRYNTTYDGYSTVVVPTLNNLMKKIPERIDVNLNAHMDTDSYSTVTLGKDFEISGDYEVSIPMVFDALDFEYTEEIDNVLGDDSDDITDYIKEIKSVTVKFDILNTVPAQFTPSIVAYDKDGNRLNNVVAKVNGVIAKGNGMKDGAVSEPVKSSVSINLSVTDGELDKLEKLDLKFAGSGSGTLNSNEYMQIKDIVITIDEAISVDLN